VSDKPPIPVSRRTDLLALGLLFLIATICFADVLAGINQLYMRDMTRYYMVSSRTGTVTSPPVSRSQRIRSMRSSTRSPG
jgi:hypothetical protein